MHQCTYCEYSSKQKSNLNKHINGVHRNLKPFKCSQCDYSCSHKSSLNRHISAIHLKLKPFKCSQCDYSCSHKWHLNRHISSVHKNIRPFRCNICSSSFTDRRSLHRHKQGVHENKSHREFRPHRYCEHNKVKESCAICNPVGHLASKIRHRIREGFKQINSRKISKTEAILGCTFQELHEHLQRKIDHWNWTRGFELGIILTNENMAIDHIKPLSTADTNEEIIQLNHYTNLQLIPQIVNMKKSDTWSEADEQFWRENIYKNHNFLDLYLPDNSIWSASKSPT